MLKGTTIRQLLTRAKLVTLLPYEGKLGTLQSELKRTCLGIRGKVIN